jgi:DNA-binding phage protein
MSTIAFDDFLAERLKNPEFAAHYLNAILDDGSPEEITQAMKAILAAGNERPVPSLSEPMVEQLQRLMHQTGLRLYAQPGSIASALPAKRKKP